jgi:membrane protease subunit HflK
VRDLVQRTLDDYKSGITIAGVQLEKLIPTASLELFRGGSACRAEPEQARGKAEQYRSQILGQAGATEVVEEAKAYDARVVAEARAEAQRFLSVLSYIARPRR